MADIFNKVNGGFGQAWSADSASFTFSGMGTAMGAGMLVQQVNVNYQQNVTRLWEIGSNKTYYVAGRTQGTMTAGRVVGPGIIMGSFYTKFGDVCNAASNNVDLNFGNGCTSGAGSTSFDGGGFTLAYLILVSVGISVTAQDMVINENLQLMFATMSLLGTAAAPAPMMAGGYGGLGGLAA